jgi:hypothetical protein
MGGGKMPKTREALAKPGGSGPVVPWVGPCGFAPGTGSSPNLRSAGSETYRFERRPTRRDFQNFKFEKASKCILFLFFLLLAGSCATVSIPPYWPEIVYDPPVDVSNHISYERLAPGERKNYAAVLYKELEKYPAEYFKIVKLKNIVLVKNLKSDNFSVAGLVDGHTNLPFIGINGKDYNITFLKSTLHHELNHYTENVLWRRLNYRWDAYDALYTGNRNPKMIRGEPYDPYKWKIYTPALRGFLNYYSALEPSEDRSEIISHYLTDEYHNTLLEKSKIDDLFHQKVMLLFSHYEENLGFSRLVDTYLEEREKHTF